MATQTSIPQPARLPESTELAPELVSVAEYVRTAYSPDCDYVDGEIQERNLGEQDHSRLQKKLIMYLGFRESQWGVEVFPEQRVQVSPTRFRIPDVCVVVGEPDGKIFRKPPFLCIEVLSPEDRLSRVRDRVDDYLRMGVAYIWVLDPETKVAYQITPAEGWREVKSSSLKAEISATVTIEVPLSEIFSA
ncbi:MAG: Uma2 family endonuclease [Acidobacteriota bacterium]